MTHFTEVKCAKNFSDTEVVKMTVLLQPNTTYISDYWILPHLRM